MTTPDRPPRSRRTPSKEPTKEPPLEIYRFVEGLLQRATVPSRETEAETASRLKIADDDARHDREEQRREKDHRRSVETKMIWGVLAVVAVVCPACLYVLVLDGRPADQKSWAAPMLTLIFGGLTGFFTGRTSARPEK